MSPKADRTPINVLLIEDNPGDVRLIQESLRNTRPEFRATVARDGDEAMALLRNNKDGAGPFRPDLIFLDLNLPGISGRELLAEFKQDSSLRSIPVIVLTSSTNEEDVKGCYDLQCCSYIAKPLGFEEFSSVMKLLKAFWLDTVLLPATIATAPPGT